MERISIISNQEDLCGETPMWDWNNKMLFWSDMLGGKLFQYDPSTKNIKTIAQGPNVSGFTINQKGGLVCATHQGVFLWNESDGFSCIAKTYQEHELHCNDATGDPAGRFLFGTTFYDPNSKDNYPLGKLFKMEKNGEIGILEEGLHLSNGIGFSPDGKILYLTDTTLRIIYQYDYDANKGMLSNRRTFVKLSDEDGIPDGLTVDAEGFVWSALWYGKSVVRFDPDGKLERRIETPASQTSSVMFGGADLTDLYITTANKYVDLTCKPTGFDFSDYPGGPLYCYRSDVAGKPEYFADLELNNSLKK